VLEHFTVDGNNTRVAVITFSTSSSVDINDLEPRSQTDVVTTKCSLYTRLDNLVAKHAPYGYTATHDALQLATAVSARCVALMHRLIGRYRHSHHRHPPDTSYSGGLDKRKA